MKQILITSALVAVFGALSASAAGASMALPAVTVAPLGLAVPVAQKKHHYVVRGTVTPRRVPLPKPAASQYEYTPDLPLLYNLAEPYNPIEFPYNDPMRQSYPGLGLYR